MNNIRLFADNRYHDDMNDPLPPSSGLSNEFDYDDPEFCDVYGPMDELWYDEASLRFLRDFILNCSLYVSELEETVRRESSDFWEAREHAYQIVSELLIDLYQQEQEE
jgi:hypothetical protein